MNSLAIPSSDGTVTFAFNSTVPDHGAEVRVVDVDAGGLADTNCSTFTVPTGLSGYQYIETQVTISSWSPNYHDVDMSIPTGKVVLMAGCYAAEMYYTGGSPDGWYNDSNWPTDTQAFYDVINRYPFVSRPHPTDSTKWRVTVYASDNARQVKINVFIIVANA